MKPAPLNYSTLKSYLAAQEAAPTKPTKETPDGSTVHSVDNGRTDSGADRRNGPAPIARLHADQPQRLPHLRHVAQATERAEVPAAQAQVRPLRPQHTRPVAPSPAPQPHAKGAGAVAGRIPVRDNPCGSCPYRKDTPPGVWHPDEYAKLPAWDNPMEMHAGVFMCHQSALGQKDSACRGWFEVHHENVGVRMAAAARLTVAQREPTKIPLYASGAEACAAGMRGVRRPNAAAKSLIGKITKARAGAPPATNAAKAEEGKR